MFWEKIDTHGFYWRQTAEFQISLFNKGELQFLLLLKYLLRFYVAGSIIQLFESYSHSFLSIIVTGGAVHLTKSCSLVVIPDLHPDVSNRTSVFFYVCSLSSLKHGKIWLLTSLIWCVVWNRFIIMTFKRQHSRDENNLVTQNTLQLVAFQTVFMQD